MIVDRGSVLIDKCRTRGVLGRVSVSELLAIDAGLRRFLDLL